MTNYSMLCLQYFIDFKGDIIHVASNADFFQFSKDRFIPEAYVYDTKGTLRERRDVKLNTYAKNIDWRRPLQGFGDWDGDPNDMSLQSRSRYRTDIEFFSGRNEIISGGSLIADEAFWICSEEIGPQQFFMQEVDVCLVANTYDLSPFVILRRQRRVIYHSFCDRGLPRNYEDVMNKKIDPGSMLPVYNESRIFIGYLYFRSFDGELDCQCFFFGCKGERLLPGTNIITCANAPEIRLKKWKRGNLHIADMRYEGNVGVVK